MSFKKLSIPPPLIIFFKSYFAGCPFYYRRGLLSGKKFFQALYYGSIISAKPTITPVLSSPFLSFVSVSQPTTIRPRELLPLHNGTKCFCITSVVVFKKSLWGFFLAAFRLLRFSVSRSKAIIVTIQVRKVFGCVFRERGRGKAKPRADKRIVDEAALVVDAYESPAFT